ncbi:MAG: adenylate/guanylate cyclase domain-containing protein [Elusimicrobiota bacterium]|nr:adenylate/guanylate cyclase domain-containing protein [Elusimicrobiota bacterium]
MAEATTRHLSVLLTDIKGFTSKTAHKSRADIARMLAEHRDVVLPVLEARGGKLIKTIGDAFLMTFESPTDAVLAGVAVQDALAKHNAGRPAHERIEIRVAVNAGEVSLIEGDVYGDAVNITARVESIAEVNQVYFTEAVYLAMNKSEVRCSEVGLVALKGVPQKVRVYRVGEAPPSAVADGLREAAVKAKFASLTVLPAAKAVASAVAPYRRRAAALALDVAACALLLGVFAAAVPAPVEEVRVPVREAAGDQFVDALRDAWASIRGRGPAVETRRFVVVRRPRPRGTLLLLAGGVIAAAYFGFFRLRRSATPGRRALGLD